LTLLQDYKLLCGGSFGLGFFSFIQIVQSGWSSEPPEPGKLVAKKLKKKNSNLFFIFCSFFFFLGFHEAIGDTMALAVNTPAHLEGLELLPKTSLSGSKDEEKENIAYLFHVALQKVS
jgi:hypothetical protein